LIYGSYTYPRRALWVSGVIILLLMIITAFLGYVLVWGQMSFWAATVITNLVSVIPFVGNNIVTWLWSGFSVDNPTLNKFFSLHYLLPFVILAVVALHLLLLHSTGSTNPLGPSFIVDGIPFHPYYTIKDGLSVIALLGIFLVFVFYNPNLLGHPDNYIPADSSQTPAHIVPEWYFLLFYGILRSIPNKALGVVALLSSIICLVALPFLYKPFSRNTMNKPLVLILTLIFISNAIVLSYLGACPLEEPYLSLGQLSTEVYFAYFLILPIADYIERKGVRFFIIGRRKVTQRKVRVLR